MATDLGQPKTASPSRYEQFVEQQLDRAQGRIRRIDTVVWLLGLLIAVAGYGLVMAVLDRLFTLSAAVRATAFVAFLAALVLALGWLVFRLVTRRVNPYYAARTLEQTLPNAKNSLVSWLDLRDEPMPPVIRGTLGHKAARDLTGADLESAVSARRTFWLAGVLGTLVLVLLVWYLLRGSQFTSLLLRAFAPFEKTVIPTRTAITLLRPAGGNVTVPVRQDVQIRVKVDGRVPRINQPDALQLHVRYRPTDPYLVRPLDEDANGEWVKTLVADEVQNGFWYKVTGGDTETPEYQVQVRANPQVTRFDVKTKYRPYLILAEQENRYGPGQSRSRPDLKEPRGTEVTLTTRTNRVWKSGHLLVQQGTEVKKLPGQAVADDPEAKQFSFILERDGTFQVVFTSEEGEPNVDRDKYRIEVVEDRVPLAILLEPGKDVVLPANGTLRLKGLAADDHGVKAMTLRLRVVQGPGAPELQAKPYRPGVSFKLADGTYPKNRDYVDFVALEKLQSAKGEPYPLAAGMQIEYWLEAVDNCDYPNPAGQVGKSEAYKVTIAEPDRDQARQQQERQQAEKAQANHNAQQDQQQQQRNQQAEQKKGDAKLSPEEKAKKEEERRKQFEEQAEKVRQELERQQREKEQKGAAKGDEQNEPKGDRKDKGPQGDTQAGNSKDEKQPNSGEAGQKKDEGKGGEKADKGQARDGGGKQGPPDQQLGAGKDEGKKQDPQAGGPGQAKDQKGAKQDSDPSQAKGPGQQPPKDQPGAGKDEGGKGQKQEHARAKEGGPEQMAGGQQKGTEKAAGGQDGKKQETAKAKGDGKKQDGQPQQAQGDTKAGPRDQVAECKGGPPNGQPSGAGTQKGAGGQPQGGEQRAEGSAKGGQPPQARGSEKQGAPSGGGQQTARGKDAGPKGEGSGNQAKGKQAPPDQTKTAGAGKGERDPGATRSADNSRREDATMADVAQLEKQLERPGQREQAAQELSRLEKEARDPAVRQAAEEALKKTGQAAASDPGSAKGGDQKQGKVASGGAKGPGQKQDAKQADAGGSKGGGEKGEPKAGKGKDDGGPTKGQVARGEPKEGGKRPSGTRAGHGTAGLEDDPVAAAVDEAARRRAGELQLEDLRKRLMDPRVRKPLNWTENDVEQFLQKARDYQEWLRQQEKVAGPERLPEVGSPKSILPSEGPRKIGQAPNPTRDPLELGIAQPPPEFREAQRIFTSRPRP